MSKKIFDDEQSTNFDQFSFFHIRIDDNLIFVGYEKLLVSPMTKRHHGTTDPLFHKLSVESYANRIKYDKLFANLTASLLQNTIETYLIVVGNRNDSKCFPNRREQRGNLSLHNNENHEILTIQKLLAILLIILTKFCNLINQPKSSFVITSSPNK